MDLHEIFRKVGNGPVNKWLNVGGNPGRITILVRCALVHISTVSVQIVTSLFCELLIPQRRIISWLRHCRCESETPGDIVLDGDPAPQKKGTVPQFSAHVRCDQLAGWIKMPIGMEVGLGQDNFVLDGHQAPPTPSPKGAQPPPILGQWLLWPNGWVHQDTIWYGRRPWPGRHTTRNILWSRVSVCLSVCLSVAACLHYCTDPDVTWGVVGDACL